MVTRGITRYKWGGSPREKEGSKKQCCERNRKIEEIERREAQQIGAEAEGEGEANSEE